MRFFIKDGITFVKTEGESINTVSDKGRIEITICLKKLGCYRDSMANFRLNNK